VAELRPFGGREHVGRLPWPTPTELDEPRRRLYEKIAAGPRASGPQVFELIDSEGRLHGPFNAMLVSPEVGDALQALGAAIRYRTFLTDRGREIAILVISVARRSEFEWYAHERVGRRVGLSDEELKVLADLGSAPPTFDVYEAVVYETVLDLVRLGDLDDEAFERALEAVGLIELQELIALVGYYDLLALSLRVWRTPLPSGERGRFADTEAL
jgi:4-carboxymuconolactone decarboxylase